VRARIALLSIIGLACLAALWWAGWASILLQADRLYAAPVIGLCVALGLVFGWLGRWDQTAWIGDKLPVLGLVGTVAGVLLAFHDHPDLTADSGAAATEIGRALIANLLGIAGFGWLSLVEHVCAD
jgi:MotA/TolQ/ExbB proton channel family